MPAKKKIREDALAVAKRRREVATLWARGRFSVRDIAAQLGVSATTVQGDKEAILADLRKETVGLFAEYVAREALSLDAIDRQVQKQIQQAVDSETKATFLGLAIRVSESRRSLLGLDARKETGASPLFRAPRKKPGG